MPKIITFRFLDDTGHGDDHEPLTHIYLTENQEQEIHALNGLKRLNR